MLESDLALLNIRLAMTYRWALKRQAWNTLVRKAMPAGQATRWQWWRRS